MRSGQTLLLTGANGYVGKHLLVALLEKGHRVITLVRRRNGSLEERLVLALEPFAKLWSGHLEVIEGDITVAGCGVDPATLDRLRALGIDACIHSAGLTRFDDHLEEEIRDHNLHGTRRVFELCTSLGIPHFHHISTSFVAGDYAQRFRETDLNVGQDFRNPYERAKYDAEQYLRQVSGNGDTSIHIYRPSIVIGGYMLGESNSASTVYTFLKSLHFIRQCCVLDLKKGRNKFAPLGARIEGDEIFIPLRVAADPDATLNLVHIEQVVAVLTAGIEGAADSFSVRHIVGSRDFDLDEVRRVFCGSMGIRGPVYVTEDEFANAPRNSLEERFFRSTRAYQPYMHSRPMFDQGEFAAGNERGADLDELVEEFLGHMEHKEQSKPSPNLGGLALECLSVDSARHYFDKLVGREFGTDFLGGRNYLDASIRFIVHGKPTFDRTLRFSKGHAAYLPDSDEAVCSYEMDERTFRDISHSYLDPKQAFFKGLIKISGDMETGLKFAHILSDYYRHIDDHVIDELSEAC